MSKRILCHLTLVLLLLSLIPVGLQFSSQNVSAGTNHWFVGVSSQNAADASAWLPATVPSTGDDIYFSALSINNCNWNLAGSFGAFNLLANFTKTVTQTTSFTISLYSQAAGIFTGSASYWLTDSGNFIKTSGTVSTDVLKLKMTGTGSSLSSNAQFSFYKLEIAALGITMPHSLNTYVLSINTDCSLILSSILTWLTFAGDSSFTNNGLIVGIGSFQILMYDRNVSAAIGIIGDCGIIGYGASTGNWILTPTGPVTMNAFQAYSEDPIHTVTFDLTASNFPFTVAGIIIDTGAIFNSRGSIIIDTDDWDIQYGTFIKGTSSVHLTGIDRNLITNDQSFHNLIVESGASYTLQSNVKTYNYWNNGTMSLGGYTMTVNNDQAPIVTSSPTTSIPFTSSYSYAVVATDREAETLTYGLNSDLPGVAINSTTGLVSKSAPLANGSFYMHVSVTDGNHTTYQNYTLTVTNSAPYFTSIPVVTMTEGDHYSYQANATDPEGYSITYGMSTTAPFLSSMDAFHYFSGTPSTAEAGTYYVNISASDGYRVTYQNYSLEVKSIESQTFTPQLLISLIFGFGLVGLGLKAKEFWILAGLVWVFCGLTVFLSYGTPYMMMTSMFGIALMFGGVYDVWK